MANPFPYLKGERKALLGDDIHDPAHSWRGWRQDSLHLLFLQFHRFFQKLGLDRRLERIRLAGAFDCRYVSSHG